MEFGLGHQVDDEPGAYVEESRAFYEAAGRGPRLHLAPDLDGVSRLGSHCVVD